MSLTNGSISVENWQKMLNNNQKQDLKYHLIYDVLTKPLISSYDIE